MGEETPTDSSRRVPTTRAATRTHASGARIVLSVREGDRIEDFTLVRRLGRGGMGDVWEAEQDTPRRRVALKFFMGHGLDDGDRERRLREEADRASRLEHRNIITIYQVGRDFPYIAQELVPGGRTRKDERQDVLAERSFDGFVRWAAETTRKIADGIQAAHDQGVVHRDIKLANVLVREDGEPLVIDFGIAAVEDAPAGTHTENLVGTPRCLAPEQIVEGRTGKSPAADVYQLGLLLHDLLTGEAAFRGKSHRETRRLIEQGVFPRPRSVEPRTPFALEAICLRAMAFRPEERYPSAAALRDDLERWSSGHLPLAARGGRIAGRLREAQAFLRRRRGAVFLALLVASVAVLPFGLGGGPVDVAPAIDLEWIRLREYVPFEGLWVFASQQPDERLEHWMSELDKTARRRGTDRVPYEFAGPNYEASQESLRGASPRLTEADRARFSELTVAELLGEDPWKLDEPRRFEAWFPVDLDG